MKGHLSTSLSARSFITPVFRCETWSNNDHKNVLTVLPGGCGSEQSDGKILETGSDRMLSPSGTMEQ